MTPYIPRKHTISNVATAVKGSLNAFSFKSECSGNSAAILGLTGCESLYEQMDGI